MPPDVIEKAKALFASCPMQCCNCCMNFGADMQGDVVRLFVYTELVDGRRIAATARFNADEWCPYRTQRLIMGAAANVRAKVARLVDPEDVRDK